MRANFSFTAAPDYFGRATTKMNIGEQRCTKSCVHICVQVNIYIHIHTARIQRHKTVTRHDVAHARLRESIMPSKQPAPTPTRCSASVIPDAGASQSRRKRRIRVSPLSRDIAALFRGVSSFSMSQISNKLDLCGG